MLAATLGISVATENDATAPIPESSTGRGLREGSRRLLADAGDTDRRPIRRSSARDTWLRRNRVHIDELADNWSTGRAPVWAMDLDDCVGSLAVKLDGLVDLQRAILASARVVDRCR